MNKQLLKLILLVLVGSIWLFESKAQDASTTINNDTFWYTTAKKPIYSQGGGIFRFPDPTTGQEHNNKGAETYLASPTGKNGDTGFNTTLLTSKLINYEVS